jgi:hypothetical protein
VRNLWSKANRTSYEAVRSVLFWRGGHGGRKVVTKPAAPEQETEAEKLVLAWVEFLEPALSRPAAVEYLKQEALDLILARDSAREEVASLHSTVAAMSANPTLGKG